MRPVRLVLQGFTAFRDRTEIDFEGVDLFALVGPTGSGKSSVIDAITFALYGQVARYDNAKLVGPVITQGAVSASVDLTFVIGSEEYRIHREVVRKGTGGSTKEVRLEHGDETLAGKASEADAVLADLLGLSFDQFTTCVVLPQGEFARFLHEKPKERRSLLVQLLDLGSYAAMATRANAEASQASAQADLLDQQLEGLAEVLAVDRTALRKRIDRLVAAEAQVSAARPRLEELGRSISVAEQAASSAARSAELLAGVIVPDGVRENALLLAEAAEAVIATERREAEAEEHLSGLEDARRQLPERAEIQQARQRYERRGGLTERLAEGEAATDSAREAETAAGLALAAAEAEHRDALATLATAERTHAAQALAGELSAGDPCPVCHRPVDEVPNHDLADLQALTRVRDGTGQALEAARRAREEAAQERARCEEQLRSLVDQLAEVDRELAQTPPPEELDDQEARLAQADEAIVAARAGRDAARDQRKKAESKQQQVEKLAKIDDDEFAELRESLAMLEPPRAGRQRLLDDWEALAEWARERHPQLEREAAVARDEADRLRAEQVGLADTVGRACREVGVDPEADDPLERVGVLRRDAERDLDRADQAHEQASEWRSTRSELQSRAEVSRLLGRLLRSDGFQHWLLDEAVGALVDGATERLRSLSRGQYSLAVDDKGDFQVVDHFNADEVRIARTLSGGETFLASLALALALSDQIADLAAEGAPRLESIFLDEGFGTLDPETLDVVVDAIEGLGATGRMVGLVSHVRDLAERVPVRFAVAKGPSTATIERIEQ